MGEGVQIMRDDPIIRRIESTGYGSGYTPARDPYWITPDGDSIPEEDLVKSIVDLVKEDPSWAAECLGYEWREG